MNLIKILYLFFAVWVYAFTGGMTNPPTDSLWERGLREKKQGNFEKALQIWGEAGTADSRPDSSFHDPRIGFGYIELATSQKLKSYYKKASRLYYWGLSQCSGKYLDEIKLEIERLKPILKEKEYKNWKNSLTDNPEATCQFIIDFWKELDPTVNTPYNERLIEHWERIAYVKKNFNLAGNTVYGTDERSLIYIKLGKPDYEKDGTIQFRYGLVRTWIQDIIDFQTLSGNSGNDSSGTRSTGPTTERGASIAAAFEQQMGENAKVDAIMKKALQYHRYPSYEIWVYRNAVPDDGGNIVYIFGQDGDTGTFGLRNSLDEMIPSAAFKRSFSQQGVLTSGLLLQLVFYEQTTQIDTYFENAFSNIESRLFTRNGLTRHTSSSLEHINTSRLNSIQYSAPQEQSDYLKSLPHINLNVYQYRFLNNDNEPYLGSFIESRPQKALVLDQIRGQNFLQKDYDYYHSAIVANSLNQIVQRKRNKTTLHLESKGQIKDMRSSESYFKVFDKGKGATQTFVADLYNKKADSIKIGDKGFPENLRGYGRIKIMQPKPLSTDVNQLVISDIMMGYKQGNISSGPADFKVVHNRTIPVAKNLMLYFEVYHLKDTPGTNKFTIEYKITPKESNFFKRLFGKKDKVGLTLNYETLDSQYYNDLEIVTSSFKPGEYKLHLKIAEPDTKREVERDITFKIQKGGTQ